MKITDIWKSKSAPTISFEFLPPKTPKAAETLEKTIAALPELRLDFVSVTFGAGGSTRGGSRELVARLKQEQGLETIAYFAGFGLAPDKVIEILNDYRDLGLDNVLLVRGDPPHDSKGLQGPDCFDHASDLIEFARPSYDFCVGAAGYPEGHIDCVSVERDIEFLKIKIDNGADYIVTNYCYDNAFFFRFVDRCRAAGIEAPILPGVMPVYSVKMMEILAGICGATITDELRQGIDALPEGDTKALQEFGVEFATRQCRELLEAGVPGLHFYTMNRLGSISGILERLRSDGVVT